VYTVCIERYWLSFVFLLLFLDTGSVHLISLMWLEDVIASSSSSLVGLLSQCS